MRGVPAVMGSSRCSDEASAAGDGGPEAVVAASREGAECEGEAEVGVEAAAGRWEGAEGEGETVRRPSEGRPRGEQPGERRGEVAVGAAAGATPSDTASPWPTGTAAIARCSADSCPVWASTLAARPSFCSCSAWNLAKMVVSSEVTAAATWAVPSPVCAVRRKFSERKRCASARDQPRSV